MAAEADVFTEKTDTEFLFSTEGITKKYKLTTANDSISVSVPRGRIIGFVGENGSGKTTFLRLLTGLSYPTSGSFKFHTESGKCRIGAIVETPAYHPSMSAEDNLRFQAKLCGIDESKVPEMLKTVGLQDTGKKKARFFSLGMRQRLGIGIALLSDPELLILDEPTNGLDPQGIIELREFLKQLCRVKKITLMISSHILSELSLLADDYLFIHKGKLVKSISAEDLFRDMGKQIRFRCEEDPSGVFPGVLQKNGEWYVLSGPFDYPSLLEKLSKLGVTDLETGTETLETRYMSIIYGGERV